MSYYRQQNRYRLSIGEEGNPLVMLIAINLIVFTLLSFIKVIYFFTEASSAEALAAYNNNILDWVVLPASLSKLATRLW